jgi:actin-related protein
MSTFVLDLGSSSIKYGKSIEKKPEGIIKSIVGKKNNLNLGEVNNKLEFGEEVLKKDNVENLNYPIERGEIKKEEYFEKLLQKCLKNLKIDAEEYNFFIAHGLQGSKKNMEIICQMLFEEFYVPKLFLELSSVCSIFSEDLTTGLVLDIGEGKTEVLPIVILLLTSTV